MRKECLECGETLFGRIDKKFCNDYCRNTFNNKINKESKNMVRNINNRLRRNYKILSELNCDNPTTIKRSTLVESNFNFEYHTSIEYTPTGETFFFIYDQGYTALGEDRIILIEKN